MLSRLIKLSILTVLLATYAFAFFVILDSRPLSESREQSTYYLTTTLFMGGAWLLSFGINRLLGTSAESEERLDRILLILSLWLSFSIWTARLEHWALLSFGLGLLFTVFTLFFYQRLPQFLWLLLTAIAMLGFVLLLSPFSPAYLFVAVLLLGILLMYQKYPQRLYSLLALSSLVSLYPFLPSPGASSIFTWIIFIGGILIIVYAIGFSNFIEKLSQSRDFHINDSRKRLFFDVLAIVLICCTVFDFSLLYDTFHYNVYIATINDIVHGRTVLVDTFSIYGVSVNYLMALPFSLGIIPVSNYGASLVTGVLTCLEIIAIYGILRALTQSIRWSYLGTALVIIFHLYISASNFLNVLVLPLPSTGVLRFGWLYILFVIVAWRSRLPQHEKLLRGLEYLVIALLATWSIEAIAFVMPAYTIVLAYEALQGQGGDWRKAIPSFLANFAISVLMLIIGIASLSLFTWLRSGEAPRFDVYINYALSLGVSNQNYQQSQRFLLPFWTAWPTLVMIYAASMAIIAHLYFAKRLSLPSTVIGLVIGGTLNFSYWVSNSSILGAQVIVPLMLLSYGLWQLQKHDSLRRIFNISAIATSLILLLYYILQINYPFYSLAGIAFAQAKGAEIPPLLDVYNREPIYRSVYRDGGIIERDIVAEDIIALAEQYIPNEETLIAFVPNEPMLMALLVLDRAQYFPLTGEFEDSLNTKAIELTVERIQPQLAALHAGQRLIAMRDWDEIGTVIQESSPERVRISQVIVSRICEDFGIRDLDTRETGVVALELVEKTADTDCGNYWEMD
jgi:hypothetical protein